MINKIVFMAFRKCFFLFISVSFFCSSYGQDSLINSLEKLKIRERIDGYEDTKAKKLYRNSSAGRTTFVFFSEVKLDCDKKNVIISGIVSPTNDAKDTTNFGLCCVDIIVAQVKRKYYLKNVRHFRETNDGLIDLTKKEGCFSIAFPLHKNDRLLFSMHDKITQYAVGKLLNECERK